MALPTETITLLKNAKLVGPLDCNGQLLNNADPDSFPAGGGGGGGGTGTGNTTAILKGDGADGFDDAVANVDYTNPAGLSSGLATKEPTLPTTNNDHYLLARRNVAAGSAYEYVNPTTVGLNTGATTAILKGNGAGGLSDAVANTDYTTPSALSSGLAAKEDTSAHNTDIATINTTLSGKADTSAVTTALAAKTDASTYNAYVTSNNAAVALKADSSAVTTALAGKADTSALTSGLASKENTLPTTANDAYVLARHNAGAGSAFFFVDPVTLGSTNASFGDGATHSNTTFNSTLAVFTTNDTGKTILCAGNIQSGTTITFVNATTVTLSNAATTTASSLTFTILNRFLAAGGGGTVTNVAVSNDSPVVSDLVTTTITNPSTSAIIHLTKPNSNAKTFYGNSAALPGPPGFMDQATAFSALDITTAGKAIAQIPNPSATTYVRIESNNSATTRTPAQVLGDVGAEPALTFNAPLARGASPNQQTISIPTAASSPGQVTGALSGADHATFTAKVSATRTISTSAPLTGGGDLTQDRTIAMPAAASNPSQLNGYLSGADHAAFTAKLSSTRTISTTAPLTGGGDLTQDRTIAMPAATSGATNVSGYLTTADHATFTAKVPGTRSLTTTAPLRINNPPFGQQSNVAVDLTANRIIDIPKATSTVDGYLAASDFGTFLAGSLNTLTAAASGTMTQIAITSPLTTRVVFLTQLVGNLTIPLPSATPYANGFIEFVDLTPGGAFANFSCTLRPSGSDTIDGVTGDLVLSRALGYLRLNSGGATRWFTTKYFVETFKNPNDPTSQVRVDASQIPHATTYTFSPSYAGNSVSVVPLAAQGDEVIRSVGLDGQLGHSPLTADQVVPGEVSVLGTADAIINLTPGGKPVTIIKLITALTGTRFYTIPNTSLYDPGQEIVFFDTTGNPNGQTARLVAASGNTINGAGTFDVNDGVGKYFRRAMNADPATGNWTIAGVTGTMSSGLTYAQWTGVNIASGKVTLNCSNAYLEQHHIVNLAGGNAELLFGSGNLGPQIGMTGRVKFRQDGPGGRSITKMPVGTKTTAGGAGLITLTSSTQAEDEFGWDYDGQFYNWFPLGTNFTAAAPISFNSADWDNITGITTLGSTLEGSTSGLRYLAARFLGNGGVTDGTSYTIGKQTLRLLKNGSPNYKLTVACYSDAGGVINNPLNPIGTGSGTFDTTDASLLATEVSIDFNANFNLIGARNVTNITTVNNGFTISGALGKFDPNTDVGCCVSGTNMKLNCKITAVAADGSNATLSLSASGNSSTATITVQHPYWLVLSGDFVTAGSNSVGWAYSTITNNGAVSYSSGSGTTWTTLTGSTTRGFKFTLYKQ